MFRRLSLRAKLKRLVHEGVDDEIVGLLTSGTTSEKRDVASSLWGASATLSRDDADRVIPGLRIASDDQDSEVRANAIAALLSLKVDGALERAWSALADTEWFVRMVAAAELGHAGSQDSAPHLVPLLSDPEAMVRTQVAGALMNLRDPAFTSWLEAMLKRESDPDARRAAKEALALLNAIRNGLP